mmetsp:Transcript_25233/g.50489  ORF Transcript_25233/g.50489 Transcript_25233/m.50489 type:complete len:225 (-) Transcript_25233:687-1361(-)
MSGDEVVSIDFSPSISIAFSSSLVVVVVVFFVASFAFLQIASSTIMARSPILCRSNICFLFIPSWWSDSPVFGEQRTCSESSFHDAFESSERTESLASIGYCCKLISQSSSSSTFAADLCRNASAVDTVRGEPCVNRIEPPPCSKTIRQGSCDVNFFPSLLFRIEPTSPKTNFLLIAEANLAFNSDGEYDFSLDTPYGSTASATSVGKSGQNPPPLLPPPPLSL